MFLELQNRTWRQEYFLIDTGAPTSHLWRPFANSLQGRRSNIGGDTLKTMIEGEAVEFHITDSSTPDTRLHGINIIGTDFLNEFVIVDDYKKGSFQLLKQYKRDAVVAL